MREGTPPIGSRRRRAALRTSDNIPFEQLPYQCFQEARKVLLEDRQEKLKAIEVERARLARLRERDAAEMGGEHRKQVRIRSTEKYLEKLKILADINDPIVKKRFEDGLGMHTAFCLRSEFQNSS
jgi:large subunit ribosomal protein L35